MQGNKGVLGIVLDKWKLCEMIGFVEDLACSVGYASKEVKMLNFVGILRDLMCYGLERLVVLLGDFWESS